VQVADDLRAGITTGTFKPGERLPSGRELARRYGVAPMTIHHALAVLREEQLVESYQGRGVFITNGSSSPATGRDQAPTNAALRALRGDLNELADRVARIERRLGDDRSGSAGGS
jgi:DNA-binding GntR family transcriptional regulator